MLRHEKERWDCYNDLPKKIGVTTWMSKFKLLLPTQFAGKIPPSLSFVSGLFTLAPGDNPSAVRVLTSRLSAPSLNLRSKTGVPDCPQLNHCQVGGATLWPKCHVPSTLSLESESSTLSFCCHLCLQWICFKIIIPSQIMCPGFATPPHACMRIWCFPKSLLSKLAPWVWFTVISFQRRQLRLQRDWTSNQNSVKFAENQVTAERGELWRRGVCELWSWGATQDLSNNPSSVQTVWTGKVAPARPSRKEQL